jgi:hypothetical protein
VERFEENSDVNWCAWSRSTRLAALTELLIEVV